ncbi:MAG: hypothetical protein P8L68_00560 [Paracoccaceae bacterium]|nr:hypothetical protein [Paracoccaceae bacterium]MDG2256974.1 hypothetical protein [Paracoccaceae bacterium]
MAEVKTFGAKSALSALPISTSLQSAQRSAKRDEADLHAIAIIGRFHPLRGK